MTSVQINSFLVLSKHLNFSAAAKELCISQSTLSMHISALEKNLGVKLFERNKRNVTLSPQGAILRPVFEQTQGMIEDAVELAHKIKDHHDELKVGQLVGMRLHNYLTVILKELQDDNPELKTAIIGMSNDEILESLDSRATDVVILPDRMFDTGNGYEATALFDSNVSIVYTMNYGRASDISIDTLSQETFIIISPEIDNYDSDYLNYLGDKHGFSPAKVIGCRTQEEQLAYVKLGRGVCVSDHTSRVYGSDEYRFYDIPGEVTQCLAVRLKGSDNINVDKMFRTIKESYKKSK